MEKTDSDLLPDVFNQRRGHSSVDDAVIKVAFGTKELARLERLKDLLLENPYTLDEFQPDCGLYRWDDLKSMLQATDDELESALRVLSAVEINGYWRVVDDLYMAQMLNSIKWLSILRNWFLSCLDENEVVKALVDWGFSPVIARHCLQLYCSRTYGGSWEFDKKRVCLHFARRILAANGKMKMEPFMREWERKVPGQLPVSLGMLEGEVLVEKHGNQSWVSLPSGLFPGYFKNGPDGIGRIYTLTSVFQEMYASRYAAYARVISSRKNKRGIALK